MGEGGIILTYMSLVNFKVVKFAFGIMTFPRKN